MSLRHVVEAVVDSADAAAAVAFHRAAFDLDVLSSGPDGQALLGVHGSPTGRLRLVPSGLPPRTPQVWEVGPRLFGLYSRDVAVTAQRIRLAGGTCGDPVTYPYGSAQLTEILGQGADGVWWTIPQAATGYRPSPALDADADRLHSELHTVVLVVDDHPAALRFFAEAGGLRILFDATLAGEPFERLVGIPPGQAFRLSFLVGADQAPARLELMSFPGLGVRGDAGCGLRRIVFAVDDVAATRAALVGAGAAEADGVLLGPAGIEITLTEG